MNAIKGFIDSFVTEDYFIIFLVLMVMILIVLIMALIKTRKQYLEAVEESFQETDLLDSLKGIDYSEIVPAMEEEKNIPKPIIKTDNFTIDEYEAYDEENAVISTKELEEKTAERMDALGITDNQAMIDRYEEEQEKKAIISYEQLLKNAANITITYKEEQTAEGSPKINRIELQEKEVSAAQSYIEDEQFLKILKEFRMSMR